MTRHAVVSRVPPTRGTLALLDAKKAWKCSAGEHPVLGVGRHGGAISLLQLRGHAEHLFGERHGGELAVRRRAAGVMPLSIIRAQADGMPTVVISPIGKPTGDIPGNLITIGAHVLSKRASTSTCQTSATARRRQPSATAATLCPGAAAQ